MRDGDVSGVYDWRGRAGLLAPSRGDTLLYEFYQVAPAGIMATPYSCELSRLDRSQLESVRSKYTAGVERLTADGVDVISVGGTPPQLLHGWDSAKEMMAEMRAESKVPLVFCAESEVNVMRAAGSSRIALLTPHEGDLNERLTAMLEAEGIEVVVQRGMGIKDTSTISRVTAYDVYREIQSLYEEAKGLGIDGIHITCPRWPTINILAPLEERLGVSVTSGAQGQIRAVLSALRAPVAEGDWGRGLEPVWLEGAA